MKKSKIIVFLLMVMCIATVFSTVAAAAEPYQTYTYSSDGYALYSPAAYTPIQTIDSQHIGMQQLGVAFDEASDLFVDEDGFVYLADTKNNRIIVMEGENFKYQFSIQSFVDHTGNTGSLKGPKGVYVRRDADGNKHIYVCDTGNARLVVFDGNGKFERYINKPNSTLFGTQTLYTPVAVAVDQYGRIFVVSSSTYQGVVVLTNEGEFTGYIGAQKASYSLFEIVWRRFQTKEQRKASQKNLSTEFNNISIDADGFIYVTTNTIDEADQQGAITSKTADYAPVKKLNPAGKEIMKRNGFFAPGGEVDVQNFSTEKSTPIGPSRVVDVAIGEEGTWSIVDSKRSKIFTYDSNGKLLHAFGDNGTQMGNMQNIASIAYHGNYLLVLDSVADSFTVFKRTDYGHLLIDALRLENVQDYTNAIVTWQEVLQRNNNFDAAYIGVGQSYYRQGKYDEAMRNFEAAYDTEHWSEAYKAVRKEWIAQFFLLIPLLVIVLVVGWVFFMKFATNVNHRVAVDGKERKKYGEEIVYAFHVMFHPFDGFWDLKHEHRGSMRASLTILGVTILCFYYQAVGTGYVMNPTRVYSTIITQLLSVALPVLLWVIANWCLTTLFEGGGSLKDIFMASCYSLSPMPLILIATTIASNFVSADEAPIVTLVITIAYVWVGLLLFFGMMTIHEYSFTKNLVTTLGTILGMAIIMFVGFLFSSLVGKMVSFVSGIIVEIGYRI